VLRSSPTVTRKLSVSLCVFRAPLHWRPLNVIHQLRTPPYELGMGKSYTIWGAIREPAKAVRLSCPHKRSEETETGESTLEPTSIIKASRLMDRGFSSGVTLRCGCCLCFHFTAKSSTFQGTTLLPHLFLPWAVESGVESY
jgi:hypothetical protein